MTQHLKTNFKKLFMKDNMKKILYILMLPIMLGVGYLYAQGNNQSLYLKTVSTNDYANLINNKVFEEVKSRMDTKFYSWNASNTLPTEQDIKYNIIKGYVASFKDPFTQFFLPSEAKTFTENVKGSFGGVGMHVETKNDMIVVVAPLKNSPAYHIGIKTADIVVGVNDEDVQGKSSDYVLSKIRGEAGTDVKLKVFRSEIKEFKEFVIKREIIKVPTIDTKIIDNVFIIQLYSFTEESPELFRTAIIEYLKSGKRNLIVDVRGNPGGYLDSAVAISSFFLENGVNIVSEKSNNPSLDKSHLSYNINAINKTNTDKLYVLVDGGSASASEIFAGAIKDYNVGKIVGIKTFGKGSVQELITLSDGSAIKITTASWFTPNGTNISLTGIVPDIALKRDDKTTAESELKSVVDMMK